MKYPQEQDQQLEGIWPLAAGKKWPKNVFRKKVFNWLTQHADHVRLHDRLSKLLIDGVARYHLVAVVGVDNDRQRWLCCPAAVRARRLEQ